MNFTPSIVQVHISSNNYDADDQIWGYVCFHKIGIAVALHPGDYLLFNLREPHSLSSPCCKTDLAYSISCYLKSSLLD